MQYPNLLKRIVPFVLALALGLFVASFFVSVAAPFRFKGRAFVRKMKEENRLLKIENEDLKRRNEEMKKLHQNCGEADYEHYLLLDKDGVPLPAGAESDKRIEKRVRKHLELEKIK